MNSALLYGKTNQVNKEIQKLILGFAHFRKRYFAGEKNLYDTLLTNGQSPKTLVIGCSDSRVDPAILTNANPGEIFVVRNVANLVPPCETGGGYHGISSAIEFAVTGLKVRNIVILGHSFCGGIRALMVDGNNDSSSFISSWMKIAEEAKVKVLKEHPNASEQELCHHCEMESIVISMRNVQTFPFVKEAIKNGVKLYGIYFNLEKGELHSYSTETNSFSVVELPEV